MLYDRKSADNMLKNVVVSLGAKSVYPGWQATNVKILDNITENAVRAIRLQTTNRTKVEELNDISP